MRKPLILGLMITALPALAQISCPVSLTTGKAAQDTVSLSFRNKGKVPVEQLDLSCTPSLDHKSRTAVCHTESGIFYPGTQYWISFPYPRANRQEITVSVTAVLAAGGTIWTPRSSSSPCRALKIPRKK